MHNDAIDILIVHNKSAACKSRHLRCNLGVGLGALVPGSFFYARSNFHVFNKDTSKLPYDLPNDVLALIETSTISKHRKTRLQNALDNCFAEFPMGNVEDLALSFKTDPMSFMKIKHFGNQCRSDLETLLGITHETPMTKQIKRVELCCPNCKTWAIRTNFASRTVNLTV